MTDPVGERAYLSIGEVLDLLKDEFPDVTISKIRFLESQGLLDPERTPSGYRKFYETDVERLRWILRQQKENFLPLKVIKGRLEDVARPGGEVAPGSEPGDPPAADADGGEAEPSGPEAVAAVSAAPEPPAAAAPPPPPTGGPSPLSAGVSSVSFTLDELASASGSSTDDLADLERFGLISGRAVAGQVYYDEEALVAARLASGFRRHGVEPRHLRMFRTAAEREAGFYEQIVMPLVKQRNPDARRRARETLDELARLGEGLRAAMLRQALRDHTDIR